MRGISLITKGFIAPPGVMNIYNVIKYPLNIELSITRKNIEVLTTRKTITLNVKRS